MKDPLPLPAPCFRCGEPVLPTDKRHYYMNVPAPVHQACFMRPIIGSVAHIEKRCSCFVPGADENDDPALSIRQAAEAALARWEQMERAEFDQHSFPCHALGEDDE